MTAQASYTPGRLAYIDCVRGLAAIYVMAQHALEFAGILNLESQGPYNFFANLGQAGVFAFFLVSGFVIPFSLERSKSTTDFWRRRLTRIYPLYLAVFACTVLTHVFLFGTEIRQPVVTLVSQLFFINSWVGLQDFVGGSWTLVIEFMWYIGLFLWWRATGGIYPKLLLTVALVFSVIVGVLAIYSPVRIPLGRLGMMLACCWGLLMLEYTKGQFSRAQFYGLNVVFAAACLFLLYVGFGIRGDASRAGSLTFSIVAISWAIGAATFFFFYAFQSSAMFCNRLLIYFGSISYSVYLVHPVIFPVLIYFGWRDLPLLAIGLPLTLTASHFTYRYIEQPFVKASHKKKRVPQASAS